MTEVGTTDAERRRVVMVLSGLLWNPGTLEGAVRAGLTVTHIPQALRPVYHLIERGHVAVSGALRGTNVSPEAATARKLHAASTLLAPDHLIGIVKDLVAECDEPEHIEVEESDFVAGVPAT
jgi:hypothetical protein